MRKRGLNSTKHFLLECYTVLFTSISEATNHFTQKGHQLIPLLTVMRMFLKNAFFSVISMFDSKDASYYGAFELMEGIQGKNFY